jgi:hypothetical protein
MSVVSVRAVDGVPFFVTAPGALSLDGPKVLVRAAGFPEAQQVFVGVGRTRDVQEYLGDAARQVLTGITADGLPKVRQEGTEPSASDPARADIWVASIATTGPASLTWPEQPGSWTLVAATDGSAPAPESVELTWRLNPPTSRWPMLVGAGAVLTVAGLVALLLLVGRPRGAVER